MLKIVCVLMIFSSLIPALAFGQPADIDGHLTQLASFAGQWKISGKFVNHQTGKTSILSLSSSITPVQRGMFLQETVVIPAGIFAERETPFIVIYSYDTNRKEYRIAVLDDLIGLLDVFKGDLKDGRLQLSNEQTTAPFSQSGITQPNRLTITNITEQSFDAQWEGSHDGGKSWQQFLTLSYQRSE